MSKTIAILQANYIPWKGYFDVIASVDEFVIFDDVQYTRRDWRNRNQIKTKDGLKWLSIPVKVKGKYQQRIDETEVANTDWRTEHWNMIRHAYARAPHFQRYAPRLEELFVASSDPLLTDVNERLLRGLSALLHIETPFQRSTAYGGLGGKNERLIHVCRSAGANRYLSGPAARSYIDEAQFAAAGIEVLWKNYDGYPEYPQLFGEFTHNVSVIDLLLNVGPDAQRYLRVPA